MTRDRCRRRAIQVREIPSRHHVPDDPADSPILRASHHAGVDYLVTNDVHLLRLHPYEGLQIISMSDYYDLLHDKGLIKH